MLSAVGWLDRGDDWGDDGSGFCFYVLCYFEILLLLLIVCFSFGNHLYALCIIWGGLGLVSWMALGKSLFEFKSLFFYCNWRLF